MFYHLINSEKLMMKIMKLSNVKIALGESKILNLINKIYLFVLIIVTLTRGPNFARLNFQMMYQDSVNVEIISVIFVVDNSLMMSLIVSNTQNVANNVIQVTNLLVKIHGKNALKVISLHNPMVIIAHQYF